MLSFPLYNYNVCPPHHAQDICLSPKFIIEMLEMDIRKALKQAEIVSIGFFSTKQGGYLWRNLQEIVNSHNFIMHKSIMNDIYAILSCIIDKNVI